jgi:hypothetical protein
MLVLSSDLTLTLLVTRIRADHVQPALAADQLAVLANTFDTGANFHVHPSPEKARFSRNCGNYHCSVPPAASKWEKT